MDKEELKKLNKKEVAIVQTQLEQAMAESICTQFRIEFLAFKLLPKQNYDEFCKKVADFAKKVCTSEKEVVSLQSEMGDSGVAGESPTPSKDA